MIDIFSVMLLIYIEFILSIIQIYIRYIIISPHKSQDYKLSAVKYYLKSKNTSETCQIFECSSRSLMRWIKKFQTSQSIERKDRVNVAYKVQHKHIKFIIKEDKTITIEYLS